MMLTAGESPIWIAQQMGRTDTAMVFRRYGSWIPDATPDAGGKAVEMFSKKVDKPRLIHAYFQSTSLL
jgi:integrase